MRAGFLLLAAALPLAAQPAQATTQTISGTYLVNFTTFCGLPANPWPDGVASEFDGSYSTVIAKAVFTPKKGLASLTGVSTGAQIIVPNSTGGRVVKNPYTASGAYSSTSKTFTFGGQTYDAIYGKVVSGVVQQFEFSGVSTSTGLTAANCVVSGTASLI
jgi:hypothetical protein